MKLKKISAIMLTAILLLTAAVLPVSAAKGDPVPEHFTKDVGPETEGYSIDYHYFSPVKENDSTKYPLVIWLHGMGDGRTEGYQVTASDINYWTTEDYQKRFKESGGAFILAPRSIEEKELYWTDELVYPLRAAIDDFIDKNEENIDLQRIYIGGYSMGGKMTLKMAVAYPEMFAAIFPICPAWVPGTDATQYLKDTPVWMTSGAMDPLVSYYTFVLPTWDNILSQSSMPENCRLSTLAMTVFPNGLPNSSGHHSWYSVNGDMFSSKNKDYPMMKTQNGLGENIELTYPEGMISWLSGFTSDFDGANATDSGNSQALKSNGAVSGIASLKLFMQNFVRYISYMLFSK